MHVVDLTADLAEPSLPEIAAYRAQRFAHARGSLDSAIPADVRAMCAIDELLVVGKPHAEILRIGAEQSADLLVLGAHGRDATDLLTFGTTSHRVMRQTTCPVLTVRVSNGDSPV